MVQTTLYVSTVGVAFGNNINNKMNDPLFMPSEPGSAELLPAIAESITAALDDILASLKNIALTQPGGSDQQPSSFQVSVAQVGSRVYHIALFGVNVVAFVIILGASAYTMLFTSSPAFDFADLPSMVGGVYNDIATSSDERGAVTHLAEWEGHPADLLLGGSMVELDCKLGAGKAPIVTVRPARKQIIE
ncbi:hypothetical protein LTR08_004437 [Meristemomyces frigidus]|nr:hypothetical protein LTR08_004437 [Meristemomyces frigidus]